jgi:hypothetical protein
MSIGTLFLATNQEIIFDDHWPISLNIEKSNPRNSSQLLIFRANPSAWDEVIPLEARKKNLGLIQSKEISPRHQQQSSALTNTANTSNTSNKKPTSD